MNRNLSNLQPASKSIKNLVVGYTIRPIYNAEFFVKKMYEVSDYMKKLGFKKAEYNTYLCGYNGRNYIKVYIHENNIDNETILEWMEVINKNANITTSEYDDNIEIILPL